MQRFNIRSGRVHRVTWRLVPVLLVALGLGHTPVLAQETKAALPAIDEQAMATLMRMAEFLAKAPRFSVITDIGYEVEQAWGQKLEFGATRTLTVRRPDRLAVDITDRDGTRRGFRFDGQQLAFFGLEERAYATAQKAGDLDAAIAYFKQDLRMPLPLAELVSNNLPQVLKEKTNEAYAVENVTLGGVRCEHVALRNDWVDGEFWIAQGDQPLPQRIVLTYKREEGQPQFWANFRGWNLTPDTPDSLFTFTSADGMERISFVAGMDPDAGMKEQGAQP
jgi:hypothetical protein